MEWSVMLQQQMSRSSSDTALGSRRSVVYKHDGIKWLKFQDGFPNLFIEDVKDVTGRDGSLFLWIDYCCSVYVEQLLSCVITFDCEHF